MNLWHTTFKELDALVEFHSLVAENHFFDACKVLELDKLVKRIRDPDLADNQALIQGVIFAVERYEQMIVARLQAVKAEKKKFQESVHKLHVLFCCVQKQLCK